MTAGEHKRRDGHSHDHGAAAMRAGARHQRPLFISFLLIVGFLIVQIVVAVATGSLALLSDAGHMATDALGLGMALAAIQAASSSLTHPQRTFGLYRLEILAALGERGAAVRWSRDGCSTRRSTGSVTRPMSRLSPCSSSGSSGWA